MSPREMWWLMEAKIPPKMYGSLSEAEISDLYDRTYGDGHG